MYLPTFNDIAYNFKSISCYLSIAMECMFALSQFGQL